MKDSCVKQGQGLNCLGWEHFSTNHANNTKDVGKKTSGKWLNEQY